MHKWNSKGEKECRARLEKLKTKYAGAAEKVPHPCLRIRDENLDRARANIRRHDWAGKLYDGMVELGDHYADRSPAWIETMVPERTPLHVYGTFCPACGADNTYRMVWNYRDPETLTCFHCNAAMTDRDYPEEGRLELPRSGQTLTYYLRPEEIGDRRFSTGRNAYTWAGRKVHSSYQGAIRQNKTHHMPGVARTLAILYRLTGTDRYARAAARILTRFAQVYPNYLFHDYWNTFLDCDPLYACELMAQDKNVGRFEVNACPDQPGRSGLKSGKLIQTFWGCGRLSCGGVQAEAQHLINLAEALDLLWDAQDKNGQPFLLQHERETVVKDLLVEGLFTFTHWEGINNKVAGCRVGEVALGRFLGVPEFVHRGVQGFEPYLRGFFKFDGTTAEGSSYYLYAVSNVKDLPEAARGYTDPPSYRNKDRYDNLDLYDPDGPYATVLKARALMTLPDGRLPLAADAMEGPSGWPAPAWLHNIGLVRLGEGFAPFVRLDTGDEFALFNRPAALRPVAPPPVRDRFFPGWLLAVFNTGYERMFQDDLTGAATFLMNFYEPEGHDHPDALNISMLAEGVEVLSDLGYIGDHPLNASIRSSFKHNLVVVDESEQRPRGQRPPGNVRLLATSPDTKTIEADCRAYEQTALYRRHCVLVHRGRTPAYLVDCFRVQGGKQHHYAIHGEGVLTAPPAGEDGRQVHLKKQAGTIGGDIENLRASNPRKTPWHAAWTDGGMTMRVRMVSPVESILTGRGPGQRSHAEIGKVNDYLFARNPERGPGNTFVAVIDHYRNSPDITRVDPLALPEGAEGPVALRVHRRSGADTVLLSQNAETLTIEDIAFAGRAAVHTRDRSGRQALFLAGASRFEAEDLSITLNYASLEGAITDADAGGFQTDISIPSPLSLAGSFVQVEDPRQGCWTAYPVKSAQDRYIAVDEFSFNAGTRFRLASTFSLEETASTLLRIHTTGPAELRLHPRQRISGVELNGARLARPDSRVEDGWLVLQLTP